MVEFGYAFNEVSRAMGATGPIGFCLLFWTGTLALAEGRYVLASVL